MAVKTWKGGAAAVAQLVTGSVDTMDTGSTYIVTIGGYTVSTVGVTDVATTAGNLVTALNASPHPYFTVVTWANPSAGTITGTADVAGAPFTAALTVSGGTGTVTDFAVTTAATGPHHVNEAENWSGGALPSAADSVIIAGGTSLLYGLDALSAVALVDVDIRQTFTGSIGLEPSAFASSLDGETLDAEGIREYRSTPLELDADVITIGEHDGPGAPAGSGRILLQQVQTTASRLVILNTASVTSGGKPAVRYLAADADADLDVRYAPGGVGVGSDPGDVVTIGELLISDLTAASALYVGAGVTLTSLDQYGGNCELSAAGTVASVACKGGTLAIKGEGYTITTLDVEDGTVTDTHLNASGAEWTTINLRGGDLVLPAVADAASRSWTTCNVSRGTLAGDMSRLSSSLTVAIAAGHTSATSVTLADQ